MYFLARPLNFDCNFRQNDTPLGVFTAVVRKSRVLPQIYQMDEQGKRNFQTGRSKCSVKVVGSTQK